ncbi:sporulation protein [Priestia koreensis]|uniref:sporulation protein n=1 Tax=Priestia koreensis TaxID=284581 RepID=UPI003017BA4D
MLKKVMAKIGFGTAKVDLHMNKHEFVLGEEVRGHVKMIGGSMEQHIKDLQVEFWIQVYFKNGQVQPHRIATIPLSASFHIKPGEKEGFQFSYQLPKNLPISRGNVSFFFKTNMEIEGLVERSNKQSIRVLPAEPFTLVIKGFQALGFQEVSHSGYFDGHHQRFIFTPTDDLKGRVKEIKVEAAIRRQGVELELELDIPSFRRDRELFCDIILADQMLKNKEKLASYLHGTMEEMLLNEQRYRYNRKLHGHLEGAIGGFAGGMLGGKLVDEWFVDKMETIYDAEEPYLLSQSAKKR